jgi:UPF0271 protein
MNTKSNKEIAYVLDTSAIIGRYISDQHPNFITNHVYDEVKDFESKIFLESAIKDGNLKIFEPDMESQETVDQAVKKSGDVLRLSNADKGVAALAVCLKKEYNIMVLTDDYSLQNVLDGLEISYGSVLTKGIEKTYKWILVCKGCKKQYFPDYNENDCEICGSKLVKRRIN